jgi:hypothetical protein
MSENKMNTSKTTTRRQLQGYGVSRYYAIALTKNLTPIARQSNAYVYTLSDVIKSLRDHLERSRIKAKTRQTLEQILQVFLERLGNVLEVPFGRANASEVSKLAMRLSQAISKTDVTLAALKATAATMKGKYE